MAAAYQANRSIAVRYMSFLDNGKRKASANLEVYPTPVERHPRCPGPCPRWGQVTRWRNE